MWLLSLFKYEIPRCSPKSIRLFSINICISLTCLTVGRESVGSGRFSSFWLLWKFQLPFTQDIVVILLDCVPECGIPAVGILDCVVFGEVQGQVQDWRGCRGQGACWVQGCWGENYTLSLNPWWKIWPLPVPLKMLVLHLSLNVVNGEAQFGLVDHQQAAVLALGFGHLSGTHSQTTRTLCQGFRWHWQVCRRVQWLQGRGVGCAVVTLMLTFGFAKWSLPVYVVAIICLAIIKAVLVDKTLKESERISIINTDFVIFNYWNVQFCNILWIRC